jgi:hypothetical protein
MCQPVTGFRLLLVPVDPRLRNEWAMPAPAVVGSDGRYEWPSIRPGEYYLAAIVGVDARESLTPEYLEGAAQLGIRLAIPLGKQVVHDFAIGR